MQVPWVAAQAGKNLKKSTMELGGSDAFIVLEDAELDKTVEWAVWGRMNNTGQCCVAAKRFIVVDEIADQFIAKFQAALETLVPGDPMDASTTLGPLCSEAALLNLLDQVKRSVATGARIIMGGGRVARSGRFHGAVDPHGHQEGNSCLHRRILRPGCPLLSRCQRGRGHCSRQ